MSWTVMAWLTVRDAFEQSSVAVQVLVVVYVPAQAPATVTSAKVIVGEASQASVAVGAVNTGVAGQLIVASAP